MPGAARLRQIARVRYLGVLVALALMCVVFAASRDEFLSRANLVNLLSSTAILALVALGLTFVMIAGAFDLSLGAILALCGLVFAWAYNDLDLPAPVSVLLVAGAGAALGGALNGVLVARLGVSFLVATLGTLALGQGVIQLVSDGRTVEVSSTFMDAVAFDAVAGVPVVVLAVSLLYLGSAYLMRMTYFGRDVYAVGGNALAARLSGVSVSGTIVAVFAIAGSCAALGGVVQVARIGAASPAVGGTIVFDATAAVLLGGAALTGGVGSVGGTAVGVLFEGVLQNGLTLTGLAGPWQQIATGAIVIGSVLLNLHAPGRDGA